MHSVMFSDEMVEKLLYRERRNKKNVWYRFMWDDHIRVLFPKTPCFEFDNQFGNHTTMWIITSKHGNKSKRFHEHNWILFCGCSVHRLFFSLMHDSKAGESKNYAMSNWKGESNNFMGRLKFLLPWCFIVIITNITKLLLILSWRWSQKKTVTLACSVDN